MRCTRVLPSVLTALFLFTLCATHALAQTGGEWPQWRGPNRDGISKETGLLKQWPESGPPLAWKATGAGRGPGRSGVWGIMPPRGASVNGFVTGGRPASNPCELYPKLLHASFVEGCANAARAFNLRHT